MYNSKYALHMIIIYTFLYIFFIFILNYILIFQFPKTTNKYSTYFELLKIIINNTL